MSGDDQTRQMPISVTCHNCLCVCLLHRVKSLRGW